MEERLTQLRLFKLRRKEDTSGNTGVGEVASILVIPCGKAIMWFDDTPIQIPTVYDSISQIETVSGHGWIRTSDAVEVRDAAKILRLFGFDPVEYIRPSKLPTTKTPKKKKATKNGKKEGKDSAG